MERGIFYAPDYIINAGGVIYCAQQYEPDRVKNYTEQIERVNDTLLIIFERSVSINQSTDQVADHMAEEILFK